MANKRILFQKQYLFDATIEDLVNELVRLNYNVPNVRVDLKYGYINKVIEPDYRLWFCRNQRELSGELQNIPAVSELVIPKKELHVFRDYSGPRLIVYVGDDWLRDKGWFMNQNSSKVNSKLMKEPRRYLCYRGSPYLTHDNDLGREYDPEGLECERYLTFDIFKEFDDFFKGIVENLKKINSP